MCLINILELLQITPHLLDVNIFTMLIAMYNYNLSVFAYFAEATHMYAKRTYFFSIVIL